VLSRRAGRQLGNWDPTRRLAECPAANFVTRLSQRTQFTRVRTPLTCDNVSHAVPPVGLEPTLNAF
jgi:hypothetical protein